MKSILFNVIASCCFTRVNVIIVVRRNLIKGTNLLILNENTRHEPLYDSANKKQGTHVYRIISTYPTSAHDNYFLRIWFLVQKLDF